MELALIPPFVRHKDVQKTSYRLMLAHLCNSAPYREAFEDAGASWVILDNGAFEGSTVKAKELIALANEMQVDEVVIPDVMRSKDQTIARAELWHSSLVNDLVDEPLAEDINQAFVIQGENGFEIAECVEWAVAQEWIDTIMLPRHLAETTGNNNIRLHLTRHIKDVLKSPKAIHFLGASPLWPREYLGAMEMEVRGMDTSMPYVYGYYERRILEQLVPLNRPDDYFNVQLDDMQEFFIDENVKRMLDDIYG